MKSDMKSAEAKKFARTYELTKEYGLVKAKPKQGFINEKGDSFMNVVWTDKLRRLYILQLCVRIAIEAVFFYFYYIIQTQQHPTTTNVWITQEENNVANIMSIVPRYLVRPAHVHLSTWSVARFAMYDGWDNIVLCAALQRENLCLMVYGFLHRRPVVDRLFYV